MVGPPCRVIAVVHETVPTSAPQLRPCHALVVAVRGRILVRANTRSHGGTGSRVFRHDVALTGGNERGGP